VLELVAILGSVPTVFSLIILTSILRQPKCLRGLAYKMLY